MSNEIDSQIKESIFRDKINSFFNKFKLYIIIFFILIVAVPIYLQIKIYFEKKNNEKLFEVYSVAISDLKTNNIELATKKFKELSFSKNQIIILLSLNHLLNTQTFPRSEFKDIINILLTNKYLSNLSSDLLKIKKSLLIFDEASEESMLKILDIKKDSFFYNIKLKILYEFFLSKNQNKKATEIKLLINEN